MATFAVYASTYGVRLLALVAGLATNVIISRTIGPGGRGDVTAFISAVSLIVQLSGFGLSSSSVIELSKQPGSAKQVGTILCLASLLVLPVALISVSLFDRFAATGLTRGTLLLAILWPLTQLLALNVQSAYLGLGTYRWFNGMELAARLTCLVGVAGVALTSRATSSRILFVLFLAESLVMMVGLAHFIYRSGFGGPLQWPFVRRMAVVGFRANLSLIPAYAIVRGDVLLVRAWRGSAETGLYAVAGQVVTLMWMMPAVAGQVLISTIGRSTTRARDVARVTSVVFWLLLAGCAGAAVLGYPAIRFAFGREFTGSYVMLLLLLPGALALGVESTLVQYFNAGGYPLVIVKYWAIALSANMLLNVLTISRWGANAAAVASSIGYSIMAGLVIRQFVLESGVSLAELTRLPRSRPDVLVTAQHQGSSA